MCHKPLHPRPLLGLLAVVSRCFVRSNVDALVTLPKYCQSEKRNSGDVNRDSSSPSLPAPPRVLRLGLLGLALTGAALSNAQSLYTASEQAGPGSDISLRGDSLDGNTRYMIYPYSSAGKRGTGVQVSPDTSAYNVATLHLPRTLGNSVYEIAATNNSGRTYSNSVFVNRPRMQWTDVPEALPGQTIRIVGRNFLPFAGVTPTVTLTNATTRATYLATIVSVTDTVVKAQVPSNATAGTYTISFGTNLAGTASADPNTLTFSVRAAAADPFSLGVAWGADLNSAASNVYNAKTDTRLPAHPVGNGTTDDAQAVATDLYYLSVRGGGVLYLPAGTYRVDDGSAWSVISSNVVLRGAGKGQTILQVGYTYTASNAAPDYHYTFAFAGSNSSPEGMADLTVQNLNANSTPNGILMGTGGITSKVFIKNVDFQMGNAKPIYISNPTKAMIADSSFSSTAMSGGALQLTGASELQFLRNNEYHRANRFVVNFGQRLVLEGNTIQFDNNYRNNSTVETGGMEASEDQQLLLLNNAIGAIGAAPNRVPGDGELFLTQIAVLNDFMYTGMVRTATTRALVPTAAFPTTAWQDGRFTLPTSRMMVAIVSGKGAGQWRRATSWTSTSLAVDRAWTINPDTTSRFAIGTLNSYQQTLQGNQMYGGFYGIEWEDGALDSIAEGNTLTDTGFIGLLGYTCDCRNGQWGASGSNFSFTAGWDNAILRNTLQNTTGARPATISVASLDLMDMGMGPLMLGNDVRGNTIAGHFTAPIAAQLGKTDGLEIASLMPNHQFHVSDVLQQGTILQDNTVTNSDYPLMNYLVAPSCGFLSNVSSASVTG